MLIGCQDKSSESKRQKGEYVTRNHDQKTEIPPPLARESKPYFWEKNPHKGIAEITKEYFRCKGHSLNPIKSELVRGEMVKYHDCGGATKHSLPLIHGKEGIYPAILDCLNWIQKKTGRPVIVTSGHRCPDHNTYVDSSRDNQFSKHQIGAEADFYVQGYENNPEAILEILFSYYKEHYKGQKEYIEFKRYEKEALLAEKPWMNKEIFIKLYKATEGRNDDNRHPYPYLSIQVRHDRHTNERVVYSWDKAFGNFLRY